MDRVHLITLSDRASRGEYQDQSTPMLTAWLKGQGVKTVTASLMPDDPGPLEADLNRAVSEGAPLVLTCGGTGFGSRDITPEATRRVIEREAPGICELIRARGGHPLAFASRSVCGIAGRTVILNLSGRPAAALEQIQLAWPLLAHAVAVLRKEGEAGGALHMKIWARVNHVGWVHLWRRKEDFDAAEPSAHFFNGRSDPRWAEAVLSADEKARLGAGELVEIQDPGYLLED